jgi:GNAT superfamily N-acetyltransferase
MSSDLSLIPVAATDFEALLALRIRAMQPSLEALGRFDPQRARERFASIFAPEHMHHIVQAGQRVGCVTLRPKPGALRIDHLYIEPSAQRQGIGAWVMAWACALADLCQLTLELAALQGSDANRFYQRHGLVEVSRSDFDIEYRRAARVEPQSDGAALRSEPPAWAAVVEAMFAAVANAQPTQRAPEWGQVEREALDGATPALGAAPTQW